jgi:hypothetical protein
MLSFSRACSPSLACLSPHELARLIAGSADSSAEIAAQIERFRAIRPLDILHPHSLERKKTEVMLWALKRALQQARNSERIDLELEAVAVELEKCPSMMRRLRRQKERRVDSLQRSMDRAAGRAVSPGRKSRAGSDHGGALFRVRLGRRRSRTVRRSAQTTPRRAQVDSGGSDDGGDGPGSSCPPKSPSLKTEGSRSSRLRRLRTSGGQFAFCALAVAGFEGGSP